MSQPKTEIRDNHSFEHGLLEYRLKKQIDPLLDATTYSCSLGEVSYMDREGDYYTGDVVVALISTIPTGGKTALTAPPYLLIEIMSPGNLKSSNEIDEVNSKLNNSLGAGTNVAWVIYHSQCLPGEHHLEKFHEGVQVFLPGDVPVNILTHPKLSNGNLEDSGLNLNITTEFCLAIFLILNNTCNYLIALHRLNKSKLETLDDEFREI
jgi:Uma2 family endonuclease